MISHHWRHIPLGTTRISRVSRPRWYYGVDDGGNEMKWVGSLNFSHLRVAGDIGNLMAVGIKYTYKI